MTVNELKAFVDKLVADERGEREVKALFGTERRDLEDVLLSFNRNDVLLDFRGWDGDL